VRGKGSGFRRGRRQDPFESRRRADASWSMNLRSFKMSLKSYVGVCCRTGATSDNRQWGTVESGLMKQHLCRAIEAVVTT
jgi:hypothetical protein